MKIAIIKSGGKQYLVSEGSKIKIEKIKNAADSKNLVFNEVLLYADDEKCLFGEPYLSNVYVGGELLNKKNSKVLVLKYKPKTRYRKKKGYKKEIWEVRITNISLQK